MIWSAVGRLMSPRSSTKQVPLFPPLMNAIMAFTAGSALITSLTASCRAFSAGNEVSCGASVVTIIVPVSCWGKRPLGMTT